MSHPLKITEIARLIDKCARENRPAHEFLASCQAEALADLLPDMKPETIEEVVVLVAFGRAKMMTHLVHGSSTPERIQEMATYCNRTLMSVINYLVTEMLNGKADELGLTYVLEREHLKRLRLITEPDEQPAADDTTDRPDTLSIEEMQRLWQAEAKPRGPSGEATVQ